MNKNRVLKILRYADRIDKYDSDPVSIQAGIIDNCFNKCHMCNHHKRKNKSILSSVDWTTFLNQHPGVESVCYSGGDMMIHPEVNSIMECHLESSKAFGFITAGYIPNYVSLQLLKEARWVRVSLDSVDAKIYSECRGGLPVSVVLKSIDKALAEGVNIELTITASKISGIGLPQLFMYALDHGLNLDIHPVYGSSFKELEVEDALVHWERVFSRNSLSFAPYKFGNYKFEKCLAPYYQIFIDAKGDIYPCCTTAGDTELGPKMNKFGTIWDWEKFLFERDSFSKSTKLPGACINCVGRFGEINIVANKKDSPEYKSFF